jgi:hypothetical protein
VSEQILFRAIYRLVLRSLLQNRISTYPWGFNRCPECIELVNVQRLEELIIEVRRIYSVIGGLRMQGESDAQGEDES